jgi:hypothetical protein
VVTPVTRKHPRACATAIALLVALAGTASTRALAAAQTPAALDKRAAQARQACASGKVEEAIELLAQILVETGDTNAMYNQARCYQANGRSVQALVRFREYLRIAGPLAPAERNQIRRFITELEQSVGAQPRPTAAASPTVNETRGPADTPPTTGGRTLRLFSVATALLAIAPFAAALHFGGVARQREQEILQRSEPIPGPEAQRQWSRAKRAFTLEWVSYGIGAGMLVGAGALFFLGGRSSSGENYALNAGMGADSATVTFSGRF